MHYNKLQAIQSRQAVSSVVTLGECVGVFLTEEPISLKYTTASPFPHMQLYTTRILLAPHQYKHPTIISIHSGFLKIGTGA